MTAPTEARPDIDLADMPRLEATPTCEMAWDHVPCSRPATWRGLSSCPACGRVFSDLVCAPCRQQLEEWWDDDAAKWSTICCQAVPTRHVWMPL